MILSLQALAPAALLLAGGLWLLVRPRALVFVLVQVLVLAALARLSTIAAAPVTVTVYNPLPDIPLVVRLDPLSLFFAASAAAASLLAALAGAGPGGRRPPLGWMTLAELGAVGAILAGDLPGMAAGWGLAVSALLMLALVPEARGRGLVRPSEATTRTIVLHLAAAALVLAGAVGVEALAGTTAYDAIPVGALDTRTGLLLAASPILVLAGLSGLVRACRRPGVAAVMVAGVFVPLAVYLLARTADLAEGHPLPALVDSCLVAGGGIGALVYALYALWAADLGAAVARLLSALGLLLVAAFGVAGAGGLVAMLAGFLSLQVTAVVAFGVLEAGAGRLPARGPLPSAVLGAAALVLLMLLVGLPLGLAFDARLLLLRQLLGQGAAGLVLLVPVAAAALAIAAAGLAAGRFGGGAVLGLRRSVQLLGVVLLALAAEVASPWLVDGAANLAAAAGHVGLADVRTTVAASLPPWPLAAGLAGLLVVLAAAGVQAGIYDRSDGLRVAPDLLPPRLAVTPGIALRRLAGNLRGRASATAATAAAHPRLEVVGAWLVAVLLVIAGSR